MNKNNESQTIRVIIHPVDHGFIIWSKDLPTMNLFVKKRRQIVPAVRQAVTYLYLHNEQMEITSFKWLSPLRRLNKPVEREMQFALAA